MADALFAGDPVDVFLVLAMAGRVEVGLVLDAVAVSRDSGTDCHTGKVGIRQGFEDCAATYCSPSGDCMSSSLVVLGSSTYGLSPCDCWTKIPRGSFSSFSCLNRYRQLPSPPTSTTA